MVAIEKKAKDNTSYEVRKRWNNANYTKIAVDIWKEDALKFKEKCKQDGVTQASVLKDAIYNFLGKK